MSSQLELDVRLLNESDLFDDSWYVLNYPFVPLSNMTPAEHYLRFGARLGYLPCNDFDPAGYSKFNPDVHHLKMDPLIHYIRFGIAEGRSATAFTPQLTRSAAVAPATTSLALPKAEIGTDTKRHVLLVSHDANIGGAPNVVLSLAQWFVSHTDYKVSIICMDGGPIVEKFEAVADTLVLGSLEIELDRQEGVRRLISEFLNGDPSFIILNSVASGGYLEVNPFISPILSYIHEMPKILGYFGPQLKLIKEQATHIFCNGVTVRDTLELEFDFSPERLSNYPSFINVSDRTITPQADKYELRKSLGLDPSISVVVGCGVVHWRKQPALFVRMAIDLLKSGVRANFIWVGDGEDKDEISLSIDKLGLSNAIHFVGYKENFRDYLAAADVFALTSIEDPFPLVCLEAGLLGVPSVFFREAGATWTFASPEGEAAAGICVPIDNHELFIESVGMLLNDPILTEHLGLTASRRVKISHNLDVSAWRLLSDIRQRTGVRPRVSVVVPNYNCCKYLDERLESIYNQSFKDYDIFLLDDCSTDRSLEILQEWQPKFADCTLHTSPENSGSPFLAWQRGVDLAQGDLIWIAEADDFCDHDMLLRLVWAFQNRGVKLAYAQSSPVDSNGASKGDYSDLYLNSIAAGRWKQSYIAPAQEEINKALGIANSIPNASAVICHLSDAKNAIKNAVKLRLAGDWAFYVSVIRGGQIAYCHDVVNYHRRHDDTITSSTEGSEQYFSELANIGALIRKLYGPEKCRDEALLKFQRREALRFESYLPISHGDLAPFEYLPDLPGLLYGVGDLGVGGAQTFAARFVSAWTKTGSPCVLVIEEQGEISDVVMSMISQAVVIVTFADIERKGLKEFLEAWGLEWILTGHWWADRAMGKLMENSQSTAKWVTVMHGCYETVIDNPESFPDWESDLARSQTYCDGWIWTAPKNKRVFERGLLAPNRTTQIINGFLPIKPKLTSRERYGLPNDALVFTIASRAIEEKGWMITYSVFEKLSKKWSDTLDSRLLMVGDGPAKTLIENAVTVGSNVQLLGFIKDLTEVISLSDVCVLPSWFSGESLPLTVIEFLAQGKPAIVSEIGLCSWSIQTSDKSMLADAGFIVSLDKDTGTINELELEYQMERFYRDRTLASSLEASAKNAFQKFDFDYMMSKYIEFFRCL